MLQQNDILGYLAVLNCPFWDRLTVDEQQLGKKHLLGSLVRLKEQLEADLDLNYLLYILNHREYLNATVNLPLHHPSLVKATNDLGKYLFEYLRNHYGITISE